MVLMSHALQAHTHKASISGLFSTRVDHDVHRPCAYGLNASNDLQATHFRGLVMTPQYNEPRTSPVILAAKDEEHG